MALLLGMPVAVAWSAANSPVVNGKIIRNYARVTFEWPKSVYFTAKANGKTVTLSFDHPADPDFSSLLSKLQPYVSDARRGVDGKSVVLTLDKPYRIRTFVSDNISGIDLLNIDPKAQAAVKPMATTKMAAAEPTQTDIDNLVARSLASLKPAAGEQTTPAEKSPPATAPAPAQPANAQPENPVTAAPAAEEPKVAQPAAEEPKVAVPTVAKPAAPSDSAAMPPDQVEQKLREEAKASGVVKVVVSPSKDNATLRFPFADRVAMASFVRSRTLWLVFDKPVKLDLADFDDLPETVIGKADILANTKLTILRVPIEDNIYPAVVKAEGSAEWTVLLTPSKRPLANAVKVQVSTDPPAPAHVFLPIQEMADSVAVKDPQVGDELVITPLFNIGEGMQTQRDFVDFSLLHTAQGIVVDKKTDGVETAQLRNGLRISTQQGAALTPNLPDLEEENGDGKQSSLTLFPYSAWKLDANASRTEVIHSLMRNVVSSDNVQSANGSRLQLAKIYLSEGLGPESIAMLDGINRTNPAYYRSAKLAALRGAANFLMYRFADAARDFAATELNSNKEADYWRNMLSDLLGTEGQYDYLALNKDYISKYPPIFRQRLAIVAADRAIDTKEYNVALKIFDTLSEDKLLDPIQNYVNFLLAKISSDTGQVSEATDMWDKLAEDYKHPFVQARAEFSRIVWGMDHETLPKEKVIDRLEKLRLAWHGDGLEMKILTVLGDLYNERKDYVNAMRIWSGGVRSFPNTSMAIEMARRMEETFIVMFNEGIADELPILDALTVYYEYRNYTPTGNAGNEMISRLADRLVAVDLLDQAAVLLDHQMHFQTEKEQRSRVGLKLATVHMLNHQPKKALQALEDSMYGENPVALRTLRNRMTAEAVADLGQYDRALQILGLDSNTETDMLRLEVYWRQKDWPRVVSTAESLLKARKDITAPLTLDESESVLRLALAYIFQNDTVQVQYLRDYFGPLMANNPNKQIFDFVTTPDVVLTPTNFDDVLKYLSQTRSFVENYKARIKLDGLDAALKPEKQKS